LKSLVITGPITLGAGFVFLQIVPPVTRVLPAGTFEPGNEVIIHGAGFKIEKITGQGSVNHTYELEMNMFVPL